MRTNVKATNWPSRDKARDTIPRESRKGEKVASARTKASRFKRNVEASIAERLEWATRKFSRIAQTDANVAHMNAADRASDKIVDALQTRAVQLLKQNA